MVVGGGPPSGSANAAVTVTGALHDLDAACLPWRIQTSQGGGCGSATAGPA